MAEKILEKTRAEQQFANSPLLASDEPRAARANGPYVQPGPEVPKIMLQASASIPTPPPMPPLPPAGDKQREEIKKREDSLEERAQAIFGDIESVDPQKIKPDNEILSAIYELPNMLAVTDPQPGKRYKWVFIGQHGYFITQARLQGWVPVQGKDPEAIDRTWTDTTRKLGDTILMRMSEEKYQELARQDFQKRMLQQRSITAELEEMADRTGVRVSKGFRNQAMLERLQEQSWARQMAEAKFKKMIEQGRIPGMEVGK